MLSVITGSCPTSSSICSDQNITKHILLWFLVHTFLSCRCLPLKCTGSIRSPKLCRLFSHFLHTFLKCQMKALVFLHNAFLCLVYLIPRHTAAKSLPPPCDLQKGQRPLWSAYSCICFLGEGTTASQLCGTRVPALLPLHQPREQHQARASSPSPYGLVAGGCTVLACWKGPGVGVLTEQHSGRPGNSSVSHQFTWKKSYPLAGSSQRKKEKKENCWIKSSAQMFFPVPSFAVAKMSKLWVQCTWEDQDKSLKGGVGEHPTALQCRQGLLRGLCLSRQSERTKVLISPSELILH